MLTYFISLNIVVTRHTNKTETGQVITIGPDCCWSFWFCWSIWCSWGWCAYLVLTRLLKMVAKCRKFWRNCCLLMSLNTNVTFVLSPSAARKTCDWISPLTGTISCNAIINNGLKKKISVVIGRGSEGVWSSYCVVAYQTKDCVRGQWQEFVMEDVTKCQ